MTRNKDRKRIIRTRMEKTGESYTAARAQVLSKSRPKQPPVDYAARAGMSDDKVVAKTGRTWRQWVQVLDGESAAAMLHRDIAVMLHEKYSVPRWWSQTVTVGYERITGLRERGQRRSGHYEAGKSRTYAVPVTRLFDAWAEAKTRRRWLAGVDPVVRTATPPRRMRLQWPDGTLVLVEFTAKGAGRSVVALAHTRLPDRAASDRVKEEWTQRLDALGSVFAGA